MATITRNATASVVQVVVSALIMFVLYRAILEMLGVEQLGIWAVVLATASASRIGELGLSASVTRFVAKYRALGNDVAARYVVQTAAISITLLLALILLAAYPLLGMLFERLFPVKALEEARTLLPYALISLMLTAVSGVFQSGLDGCQRYDWRAIVVVSGQLLYLFSALWLTPRHGLLGLAWAQIIQGVVMLVVGWLLLQRFLPGLPWLPREWRCDSFREMLGYGLQFQLGAIAMMLFDPVTKVLLGKYGGLSAAGYYEMASQFVNKARALIVSANQVMVPVVAGLKEQNPNRIHDLYSINLRMLLFIILPLYALVAAWAPLLSELWIGQYEPEFTFFVMVLALAWCINTFSVPAYFSNMGSGRIIWNTASHVWMGIANAVLGLLLGQRYGTVGVVMAMAIALITASVLIVVSFHREHHISWHLLLPREAIELAVASLVMVVAGYYVYHAMIDKNDIMRFSICMLLPLTIIVPVLWRHPLRMSLLGRVSSILAKRTTR